MLAISIYYHSLSCIQHMYLTPALFSIPTKRYNTYDQLMPITPGGSARALQSSLPACSRQMHSPDADSSSSSPASESPPPEDHYQPSGAAGHILNLASHISSSFAGSGSPSKRRLPGGSSFAAASSTRDPKSRRREEPRRGGTWEGKEGGKREKDDLVDNGIVEYLRKEIGDPFNETAFKAAS